MFKPKMIENEKTLKCALQHNLPILQVSFNPQVSKENRLLCGQCLKNLFFDGRAVGFKKVIEMIEEQQKLKMNHLEMIIMMNIKQIELFQNQVIKMKSNIIQQLDSLINNAIDWISNLQSLGLGYSNYSFQDELEIIINSKNDMNPGLNALNKDIIREFYNWNSKIHLKLEKFNKFQEYDKCIEILQKYSLDISNFNFNQSSIYDQSLLQSESIIQLNPLNFKVHKIKIWNFNKGQINLLNNLQKHSGWVNCLVYSQKQEAFLSCSSDKTIRIWQQNNNEWKSENSYQCHTKKVYCMVLNENEDELFSGSEDKRIVVWKINFKKNELIYLYSLENHTCPVKALSLNQSESLLVSCADGEDQIIIWERGLNNIMQFKYIVKQSIRSRGSKIKFLKENQFCWVTAVVGFDQMFVFELREGVFQENQEKTVQLNLQDSIVDMYLFPIIYNKQRNVMILRHKTYIYLIREQDNGKFKIVLITSNTIYYGNFSNYYKLNFKFVHKQIFLVLNNIVTFRILKNEKYFQLTQS